MLRRLFIVFILISTIAVAGCKISGTITLANGTGVEGVKVYLYGEGEAEVSSIMAYTDLNGKYVFEGFHHGTLTIEPDPENAEYTFDRDSETVTVDLFANAVVNFTATKIPTEKDQDPSEMSEVPWSTFQGNAAHTGYVPVYLNTDEFEHIWTWPDPTAEPDLINPSVVGKEPVPIYPVAAGDGKVFVTTAWESGLNVAVALDSATGGERWRYDFDEPNVIDSINPPAYANGTVYIQSGVGNDSNLWAFDAETDDLGEVVFKSEPYLNRSFLFYAPTVYEKKVGDEVVSVDVYIGGEVSVPIGENSYWFGGVYSINFGDTDEVEQWRSPLPPIEQWTPAVNEDYVIAYSPRYNYQGLIFYHLTVLDRSTGKEEISILDEGFVYNTPNFVMDLAPVLGGANNVIVINGGRLRSFDLDDPYSTSNGWEINKKDGDKEGFIGQPSVANGKIYAIYEGSLQAFDESKEVPPSPLWEWQPKPDENTCEWDDVIGDGIEDGSDVETGAVYIKDPFPMLVTDNLIFVSTPSITYAVDLGSKTEVWCYPAGGHLALSNDGMLFIATPEGELHAISTILE